MINKALLKIKNMEIELPILNGTYGPNVLDIASLYKESGLFTYDPGFVSTASCESQITFIDGDEGVLRYRGYDIKDLVDNNNGFLKISHLLLHGDLPGRTQSNKFKMVDRSQTNSIKQIKKIIKSFSTKSHPMAILIACFASLSAIYYDECEQDKKDENFKFSIKAILMVPEIIAMIYRHINNKPFIKSNKRLSYSENFVRMMFDDMSDEKVQTIANALDTIFILHADHEQNASTATVRLTGSAGANIFASLAAGVGTLWGPAHGGANEAVINMLIEIKDEKHIEDFIKKAKDKNHGFRLMGFGHRVYKNYDPRALILREICSKVLKNLGIRDDPLLKIAVKLEEIALDDEYFKSRNLYPNVDFYSGIILKAAGIPTNMFTTLFALARTSGWVSQWHEMVNSENNKIGRPRQLYTGSPHRKIK